MKSNSFLKFLMIIICPMVSSCTKSDEGTVSKTSINPPQWIHGTWLSGSTGFRFEANDFVTISRGTEISYKEQLEFYKGTGEETTSEETKTDESYRLKMTFPPGQSTIYEFTKKSESIIIWDNQISKPEFIKQ